MSETCRIISFPRVRQRSPATGQDPQATAIRFLSFSPNERDYEILAEPEVVLDVFKSLREKFDSRPAVAADEATRVYNWLLNPASSVGIFDERYYFLGEAALIAGISRRLMGVREEAALWFDRADASFRHTVNPAPYLTNVAHARLALYYDMRRYDHVLELLPSVASSLEKLKMTRELFRCQYLEASALKESGRLAEARSKLRELVGSNASQSDETILGLALISLGDLESEEGFFDQAVSFYQEAMPIIQRSGRPLLSAHLKAAMGTTFRNQGKLNLAVETFRSASAEYDSLDMRSWVAYTHVLSAEVLLALNRTREAEWEILLALPVIQEQKMVPEGFAAMSLLNESVRRRKTDPRALREVREHLQASRS